MIPHTISIHLTLNPGTLGSRPTPGAAVARPGGAAQGRSGFRV